MGAPVFDSNVIEHVVAALPLATELVATLPFFIYERGGRAPMAVKVRERVTVTYPALGPRDSWVVTVEVPGAPATIGSVPRPAPGCAPGLTLPRGGWPLPTIG